MSATEARRRWTELLRRAQSGERFIITQRGHPAAVLAPAPIERKHDPKQVAATIESIREFRKGNHLRGLSIKAMIREGRR
jgi:prevent-host-death family protein